jgi:hypothetical protein
VSFAERVRRMDPRWIWLIVMAVVWFAVLVPISISVPMEPSTRQVIQWIDSLPAGSVLFIAPEYGPGADAELNPQVRAVAILAFRHGLKIVTGSSGNILGPEEAETQIEAAARIVGGKQYGVDWVNIGYKPGSRVSENQLERDFQKGTAGVDWTGKPLSSFPLTKDIKALNNQYFAGIWSEDTGTPGCPDWLANAAIPGNLPLACGAITMEIPNFQPYLQSGQFKALLGGSKGAAELEQYAKAPGLGMAGQFMAIVASLFIIVLVALGNVAYYGTRKQGVGGK